MRITHRVKKSLSTLLLSIHLFFSFFAPFLVFAPSVRAEAGAPQIEQVGSDLSVSDYSGALATYYLHDGQIMAQEHQSSGDLDLFLGSESGEDAMAHDVERLVIKTNKQTFYLTDGQLDGSYNSSDLALSSGDEDYLFNQWQVEAAVASTILPVRQGVTYTFPLNSQVQVRFNQLPENPSVLTIEEVALSSELQAELGAISAVAYDVRTEMINGEFSYDLILPKAELDGEIEVKYAQSLTELSQAETVTQELVVEEQTVKVNDLDHMTIFVVTFENPQNLTPINPGYNDLWFDYAGGTITQVASGTNGIVSAAGSSHAEITGPVFTRWGGYSNDFPINGYDTTIDVFLDMSLADDSDLRFDFSSAIGNTTGSHRRDFIIHLGTNPAISGQWLASASNNSPGWPGNPARNPANITETGWYTIEHSFRKNSSNILEVTINLYRKTDNSLVGSWLLSDSSDIIGVTVGGNRYGWFTSQRFDFDWLAIDNALIEKHDDIISPIMTDYALSDYYLNASENSLVLSGNIEDASSSIDSVKYSIWNSTKTTLYANWTHASALDGAYDSQTESTYQVIVVSGYPDDTFILGVRGWDIAGNKASGGDFYFTIDSVAPTATIDGVAPKSLYNGDTNISVHAIDDNYLKTELYREGELSPFKTYTGAWFGLFWLSDGNYRMVVIDKAGNSTEYSFEIDKTAPAQPTGMRIIDWQGNDLGCGGFTNNRSITVDWDDSLDSDFAYYLYDIKDKEGHKTLTSSEYGNTIRDLDGYYKFKVRAVDHAGNISVASDWCGVTLDRLAPLAPVITNPDEGQVFASTPILNAWSAVIDTSGVDHYRIEYQYDDGHTFSGYPYRTTASTSRNHVPNINEQGGVQFRVQAFDNAGNEGAWSEWRHYFYDATAPTQPTDLRFINPDLACGAITNIGNITVDWSDSMDHVVGYDYKINYPLADGSGQADWQTFVTASQRSGSLNEGTHYIQVRAKDVLNRYSAWSDVCSITRDTIAPDVALTSPLTSLLRGTVEVRGSVTDANPHHYWLVIQNSSNQKVAGPGTVNDSSSFTDELFLNWDTTGVSDGDYTIKLEARDSANNKDSGSVVWQQFTVDNTAPTSTISSPVNTGNNSTIITNDWDGTIAGTASDNLTGVDRVELSIDDGSGPVIATASGDINWTYTLPTAPSEGTYTISSHAIDKAGNRENTYTVTIVFDKTIPEVALTVDPTDPDGQNNWYLTRPEVTLTATDDQDPIHGTDYIEYQWNSQTGTWTTYSAPFFIPGEGQYLLYYRAWDKAGNVSEVGIKNLRFDETELSEGPFNISADPNPTGGDTSLISWEAASDNTGINKYEILWRLDGVQHVKTVAGDVLETEIDRLTEGDWRVIVRAFDGAGHSKEASLTLTVDRTAPTAPLLEITGQRPGEVDLSWDSVADASRYIVYYGLEAGDYLYAASVGNVTDFTVSGLTAGNYFFVVRAVDASDNQSSNSNEVSILDLAGVLGGAEIAEGFQPAGEVQGVETEATEAEQAQMAKEIEQAGQVKGDSIACTGFNKGLFWLFLILELAVILLLAKFSQANWLKILAFLVLPAVFSYIVASTNLAACYQGSVMSWLAGHYYLPAYLTAMFAKMIEIFFFEE